MGQPDVRVGETRMRISSVTTRPEAGITVAAALLIEQTHPDDVADLADSASTFLLEVLATYQMARH